MNPFSLENKIIGIIKDVVSDIDRTEGLPQINILDKKEKLIVNIDFLGSRFGDNFFQPRPCEEDDDYPSFVGREKIVKGIRRYVGKQCGVDAYDHEKGLFTVSVTVPKINRTEK